DPGRRRGLVERRLVADALGGHLRFASQHRRELLLAARDADRARAIPEVTAKLAVYRRRRISRERDVARRVEAAGRRDEPDRRDLAKIVERLAPTRVATGERTHERQMPFDEIQTRIHPPHSRSIFLLASTKRKRIANGCIDLLSCGYFPHARVAIRGARN